MPIASVVLTDTFDQWRQKTNLMIDKVNSLSASGAVISITSPSVGQVLVYDGTSFSNVTMTGDVTIDSSGVTAISSGSAASLKKGRLAFAGARTTVC